VVFRPDSGDPVKIICGTERDIMDMALPERSAEEKGAVEALWDIFGGTITETGHKLLDSHVGLIYGDSISFARAEEILKRLEAKGFASANIVFGVGSYTYQFVTRDTWGWAVKATYGVVNGVPRNIFKNPKTDDGIKKSAKGLLVVHKDGAFTQEASWEQFTSDDNELKPIFRDGKLLVDHTLAEIRERVKTS
jgi:nicotinamide phosphoribosyltransferase